MSLGSAPVALGRSLALLSLGFPLFLEGLKTMSGWDGSGGDEGFLSRNGQEEEHWSGSWGPDPGPHSAWSHWVTPDTSPRPQFPNHREGARLPHLPRAVEVSRKGSSQEELSRGAAELRPEVLRAGVTRESGAVPGPGASLAEALGVMEELGAEVLGPGRRERRSGWLSEPQASSLGAWMPQSRPLGAGGLGPNPVHSCFTEGPW